MPTATPIVNDNLAQLVEWLAGQKLKGPSMKNAPVFYRNLESALDERRAGRNLVSLHKFEQGVDFSSNDFLSLATSGMLREAFLEELEQNPAFHIGSTASRIADGNNSYLELTEKQIATFHHAPTALLAGSGYDANCAIFSTIARPGDAIIYDELIHASVHDGMKTSLATTQISFRHNDADSLRETLIKLKETQPLIRQGTRCALIAVEAVYSMDGDVSPLSEIVDIVKDEFPHGNGQVIVDEAHSTGLIGENGRGLVCALGLEREVAVRLHTYGKGLGTTGAAILANETVRDTLLNFARPLIYTTAPSFPMVAAIRAGYNLMQKGHTRPLQEKVQGLVKLFCDRIGTNPDWEAAVDAGICSMPVIEDLDSKPFVTHFVPVWTRQGQNYFLTMHLHRDGYIAYPIDPPVVPRGTGRVRITIHAANTEDEVEGLVDSICAWAKEMTELESQSTGTTATRLPSAARKVYSLVQSGLFSEKDFSKLSANPFE